MYILVVPFSSLFVKIRLHYVINSFNDEYLVAIYRCDWYRLCSLRCNFSLVSCPPLTAPDNGMIDCTGSLFEDTCTFSCDDGYELTGSENRTCQSDQTWSGTETVCTLSMFADK